MNILITGGNGFVGGFIKNHLMKNHTVFSPKSSELDLRDLNAVDKWFDQHDIDTVIHCALTGREVLSSFDPVYLSDGLLMFRNLWRNRHKFKSLINLGTAFEFDLSENNSFVKEDDILNHLPDTSYGYSKNLIARVIRDTDNFYNLRLFGVCHENESLKRFFKRMINEKNPVIFNDQYLDYFYLPDIFPIIDVILDGKTKHFDINVVYNTKYRLSELAFHLYDCLGIDKKKITINGYNGRDLTGNSERLDSYNLPFIGVLKGLGNYI